jgi:hypothetical protein
MLLFFISSKGFATFFTLVIVPVIFQATIFRKRRSFEYRTAVFLLCVLATTVYGIMITAAFSLVGKRKDGYDYYHPFTVFFYVNF